MADVVYLKLGERPKEDTDWILLTKAESGKYELYAALGFARSASFDFAVVETLDSGLAEAQRRAERFNIKAIYILGASDAERP